MEIAGKKERLINAIVDIILCGVCAGVLTKIVGLFMIESWGMQYSIAISTFIIYYILFEWISGKTPGKIVSYTKVVMKDKTKIRFKHALLRTIIRLTGLVPISFLFGTELGLHDILTNTRVIIDKRVKSPAYNSKS